MNGTRQQCKADLIRLFMLFDNNDDDSIFLCFEHNRIRTVIDVISYDPTMISGLTCIPLPEASDNPKEQDVFKQPSPKKPAAVTLEPHFQVQIKIIQGYVSYRIDIREPIEDYNLITQQQIDDYCVSNEYKVYIKSSISPQHKPNFPSTAEDPTLTAFKRGIKRDPTHFNSFKRDSCWDEWEAHIRITATGQGVE